jgi:hypothetical protein
MSSPTDQNRLKVVQDYFRLADQGSREILELFHEDAEIYFPKFGFGFGRQSFFELTKGFEGALEFVRHDYDTLKIIPAGDYVFCGGDVTPQAFRRNVEGRRNSRRPFLQCLSISRRSTIKRACLP